MKRLLGVMLAAVMVFGVAGGAEAWWMPSDDVTVVNKWTKVTTNASTSVNTGANMQTGGMWSSPKLTTGSVVSVGTFSGANVNTTMLPSCRMCSKGDVMVVNEGTTVRTGASASMNTGRNTQMSMFSTQTLSTGGVNTVETSAQNQVNWTQFGVN